MSDFAIKTEGLGKCYTIGEYSGGYQTLRDTLTSLATRAFRRNADSDSPKPSRSKFWALRDVDLQIRPGEVVGIIGRNGAGKSTLLKILARITEPTAGVGFIAGSVGSLLEVGTGFHPELTGRDNIFLSGAVLGMRRSEIRRNFDEIVAFSGVEAFIDTPVKRYSSGMTLRLAFAVAAYLETEILLVDEVLAVGDVDFQRKCLDKMHAVTSEGRTVLFVSHNMAAIRGFCSRAILLEGGRVVLDGDVDAAIRKYVDRHVSEEAVVDEAELVRRAEGIFDRQDPILKAVEVSVRNVDGQPQSQFRSDEPTDLSVSYQVTRPANDTRVTITLVDEFNQTVMFTQTVDDPQEAANPHKEPGMYRATVRIPGDTFGTMRYTASVNLCSSKNDEIVFNRILQFDVEFQAYNDIHYGAGHRTFFRPRLPWAFDAQKEPFRLERDRCGKTKGWKG